MALTAAVTLIYNYGLSMAGFERYSASRAQDSLATEMKRLESENRELRESLARAQRAVQMSDSTHQELEKTLQSSSREIVKLREELNFTATSFRRPTRRAVCASRAWSSSRTAPTVSATSWC